MDVKIDWNRFDSQLYKPLLNEEIPDFKPGTIAYDDYWDEQDDRCLNGFKPKKFMPKIQGTHYYYLNMCNIELLEEGATRKTKGSPFYRELDRRMHDEFSAAKLGGYGLIIGKPRRVGLSWFGSGICEYELKFYLGNKIGVAAGQEDKAQDFYEKVQYIADNIRKEYRASISVRNSDEIRFSYKYKENKQDVEIGMQSSMYMKTMFSKPTGFEGKSLSVAIFEEAGLFQDLVAAFQSTEPCFKEGSKFFGTPLVYGTGGDIDKGSKGYKTIWSKPHVYGLKKIFISATDYYPGDGVPDEVTGESISFFDFRTGRTDSKAALKHILNERAIKDGSEGFVKHIQSYPLKEADIFIKNSGGLLNRKKLNAQKNRLHECPYLRQNGRLEWETTDPVTLRLVARAKNLKEKDKVHFERKSKVVFVEDNELGTFHKIMDPINSTRLPYNPHIAGCDSYDDEVAEGKGSLGATMFYNVFAGVSHPYDMPIAFILDRGTSDNDDEFYSDTLKGCIYYGCKMLLEHTKILIKGYFIDCGAEEFLKERPELGEHGYQSKAVNEYGLKMPNQYAKKFMTRLLRKEVNDNFNKIWFEEILDHLIDWGDENADLGSAYGMVLAYKLEMFADLTDGIADDVGDEDPLDEMASWTKGANGEWEFKSYREQNSNNDPFAYSDKTTVFDPEFDLEGQQRVDYYENQRSTEDQIKKERSDVLAEFGDDIMAFTIKQHNDKMNN